jgi:CRP/FNR family transcriptional regulator, cyclic AMP receptor protein
MSKRHTSLQLLKYAEKYSTYHANDVIFAEGQTGKHMFVIKAGTVELRVAGRVIETLKAGDVLGEMALLDKEPRSATAVAVCDSQLVPIDEEKFLFMVRQSPYFAIEVMQVLAERLRHMNQETMVLRKRGAGTSGPRPKTDEPPSPPEKRKSTRIL